MKGEVEYQCEKDGDAWICYGSDFVDLHVSDNYVYGDTKDEAIKNFIALNTQK